MKRWLKGYALYLAGALAVVAYVAWAYTREARGGGIGLSDLIGQYTSNGHVSAGVDELPVA